jgi:hypothetical protein
MIRFTAILFIVISISLNAQTFQWVDTAELNVQFNPTYLRAAVTLDDSANPIYARLIKFKEIYSSTYYGNVEIKKVTPSAEHIWADTLFGGVDIKQIITDSENNIICLGSYTDTVRIGDSSLTRIGSGISSFLLKLDQHGNFIWLKDGSGFVTEFAEITSLAKTNSNNFMLGIGSYSVVTNILTINSSGSIINNIEQLNTGTISDIEVDIYNNIWSTGFTFSGSVSFNGLDTIAPFDYNDYVVKYDATGEAKWISFIKDITVQDFKIESDDSGFIYLSGNLFDSTDFGNLHTHGPQWNYDYFITKIDQDGNYLWVNEIPLGNNQGDATVGNGDYLSCAKNGDIYLAGFFRGQIDFGNGVEVSSSGVGNYDVLVLKYNKNGEIQLAKTAGGDLYDHGSGIASDNKGNFYVTGLIQSNTVFDTINVFGNENSLFVGKVGLNNVVSVDDESKDNITNVNDFELYQNYPNPFNPVTKISWQSSVSSWQSLKIYDVLGNEVATLINEEKSVGNYEVEFDASKFSSGVYFYILKAGDFTQLRKMILLK